MENQFIKFISDYVKITESREYSKYFDEPIHVYNESCNNQFYYMLSFDYETNTGHIEIPNCGGMVDEFPKSQLQLDWTISKLSNLRVDKVWLTKWTFLDKDSYISFIKILHGENAELKQISFSADVAELNKILIHIYQCNLWISNILIINHSKVDGFDIDTMTNNHIGELSNNIFFSRYKFVETLNEILNTNIITIDSKTHIYINF